MTPIRIFISSVQREFSRERAQLRDYLRGDPLLRRFFEVFLVEDIPASDRQPDALAERVGLTPDGVKYHLARLKAAGALRRVGSDRAGRWEVMGDL